MNKLAVSAPFQVGGFSFSPEQLSVIGSLAAEGTDIEMTPFKQLYVTVEEVRTESAKKVLESAGLIVLPAGLYTKNLQACNFCKGSEEAGLDFALKLDKAVAGISVPTPIKIGYAGCALGTSEPLTKEISVVKMRNTYNVYVGGDAKGIKPVLAELLISELDEDQVIGVVIKLVQFYKQIAKGKEKFRKFVDWITIDKLKETVAS